MSLDWNVDKVKDKDTVCFHEVNGERHLTNTTYTLIWTMIPIQMPSITAKNVDEVFRRIYAYERLKGAMRNAKPAEGPMTPHFFTYDEIVAHIGLETNVTKATETALLKNWIENFYRDKTWEVRGIIEKAKAG